MKISPDNQKPLPQRDPRYLYIRVMNLKMRPFSFKADKVILKMQLASKYSESIFDLSDFTNPLRTKLIQSQAHIFKYKVEQFLNITLEQKIQKEKKDRKDKKKDKQKQIKASILSGYCRILLPPLIQYPHICHVINAQLITVKNKTQLLGKHLADLTLQVFYRLDFVADIDIIPLSATLTHNVAQVGEMKPIIELTMQEQSWQSLKAGGIHPHWSGHFHTKKQKHPIHPQFVTISNIGQNLMLNNLTIQERYLYHSENLKSKQGYFDIARFHLKSAGCFLRANIFTLPSLGKSQEVVGSSYVRMSNCGFFKHPQSPGSTCFINKDIDLFVIENEEQKYAGYLSIHVRFNFNNQSVIVPGPFLQVMPRAKVQIEMEQERQRLNKQRHQQIDNNNNV